MSSPQPGDTAPLGRIRFLSGKTAFGPEERGRALAEKQRQKERFAKELHQKHMDAVHPDGLCQIKASGTGEVLRPGRARPWRD